MTLEMVLLSDLIFKLDPKLEKYVKPTLKKPTSPYLTEDYKEINLFEKVDPSHLHNLFEGYPKKDVNFIMQHLKQGSNQKNKFLSDLISQEVSKRLFNHYSVLPYDKFPSFEGSKVLFLSYIQIKELIDLLSVFDIKLTLKTSIDKQINQHILHALSPLQLKFLKIVDKQQEKVAFKKIPLETWDKKKESLHAMLYLRGLNRLCKTFASSSFFVHEEIILRLPLKDKPLFFSLATQSEQTVKESLMGQFNSAIDFMNLPKLNS